MTHKTDAQREHEGRVMALFVLFPVWLIWLAVCSGIAIRLFIWITKLP